MTDTNIIKKELQALNTKMDKGFKHLSGLIDSLAISTSNGFDRIDKRFEEVDNRFEQIDDRFDQMDDRFDRIENISIGGHDRRLDNLEDRVRVIETKAKIKK